jgi:hypothetical protein
MAKRTTRFVKDIEEPSPINSALRAIGSWTDFDGMSLAVRLTEPFTGNTDERQNLTMAEKFILVVLYSAMVRGTDYIDRRVTQEGLAKFCGCSRSTVRRAMQKFYALGLFEVEEPAAQHHAPVLRIPVMECEDFLARWLGDGL